MMDSQDQTARNRVNQRNFRSRRQQYVKELEDKLRAYERAGFQATSRLQEAARVVARENAILRNLIRETIRCNEQQLHSYLSSAMQHLPERPHEIRALAHPFPRIETSLAILSPADKEEFQSAESHLEPDYALMPNRHGSTTQNPQLRPNIGSDRSCQDNSNPHSPNEHVLAGLDSSESTAVVQDVTGLESHRSFDSRSAGVDGSQSPELDRRQGPSMSCEEAAAIISSIRIMDGSCDIRERLGCKSIETCTVNNMEVFEVMGDGI